MKKIKGFTLIELLISIAIITILSTLVITRYDKIRRDSRDARRISDVTSIAKALGIYFTESNKFPEFSSGIKITGSDSFSNLLKTKKTMSEVPSDPISPAPITDPLSSTYDYTYTSYNNGSSFSITFCLEGNSIKNYKNNGCSLFTP